MAVPGKGHTPLGPSRKLGSLLLVDCRRGRDDDDSQFIYNFAERGIMREYFSNPGCTKLTIYYIAGLHFICSSPKVALMLLLQCSQQQVGM